MTDWRQTLAKGLDPLSGDWSQVGAGPRPAAVLALLSQGESPDLVLTVRAEGLEYHPGQICLPGGGREPSDLSPSATALRETAEEIGLARSKVSPVGQLSTQDEPYGRSWIIPVVGLWSGDMTLSAHDTREVAMVLRWPIADLADPANRVTARHPMGGRGPAWRIDGLFLWGLTGFMVDNLLRAGQWERPWDIGRTVEVPERFRR